MLSLVQGLLTARGARMLGAQLWQCQLFFFGVGIEAPNKVQLNLFCYCLKCVFLLFKNWNDAKFWNWQKPCVIYIYIYLDLPYGTYFCRCSETLELSPFLRQNPVPENKCHCEILWEIVSPRSRVFLPFGGAFSPLKNWFGSYIIYIYIYIDIYQNKLWFAQKGRSCAKLCKTYSLGKRQQLSPLWKRQDEAGYV